uniref:tetrahydrofolate synthase n=1 Tax=Timema poppense TaxID=170557 RepID=A0A7R9DEY4_TIMPO|nr:unnamed protein product [Timema poppensis]
MGTYGRYVRLDPEDVLLLNCGRFVRYNGLSATSASFSLTGVSLERLDQLSVIHVAGTKGKGSTCAFCESLLRHHGYKTGFYSSPHLVAVRERIRIDGQPLSQQDFTRHFWPVYDALRQSKMRWDGEMGRKKSLYNGDGQNMGLDLVEAVPNKPSRDVPREEVIDWIEIDKRVPVAEELSDQHIQSVASPQEAQVQEESDEEGAREDEVKEHEGDMPPYFKFLTVMAFNVFLAEEVDVAIVEVGIGGEYDCTNVLRQVNIVGITSLGLDHTSLLGTTVEEIAWQKAGIMKPGAVAFSVDQQPEGALKVLKERAVEKQCPLLVAPPLNSYDWGQHPLELGVSSQGQLLNASLALQLANSWMLSQSRSESLLHTSIRSLFCCVERRDHVVSSSLVGPHVLPEKNTSLVSSSLVGPHVLPEKNTSLVSSSLVGPHVLPEKNTSLVGSSLVGPHVLPEKNTSLVSSSLVGPHVLPEKNTSLVSSSLVGPHVLPEKNTSLVGSSLVGPHVLPEKNTSLVSSSLVGPHVLPEKNTSLVSSSLVGPHVLPEKNTSLVGSSLVGPHVLPEKNTSLVSSSLVGPHVLPEKNTSLVSSSLVGPHVLPEKNTSLVGSSLVGPHVLPEKSTSLVGSSLVGPHVLPEKSMSRESVETAPPFSITRRLALGLKLCSWPGRTQVIHKDNLLYFLDGAHTLESMALCSQWFSAATRGSAVKRVLLFNSTGDRQSSELLSPLLDCDFHLVLFCPNIVTPEVSLASGCGARRKGLSPGRTNSINSGIISADGVVGAKR